MGEDDDWFERALRADDDATAEDASEDDTDESAPDSAPEDADTGGDAPSDDAPDASFDDTPDAPTDDGARTDSDPFGGVRGPAEPTSESAAEAGAPGDGGDDTDADAGESDDGAGDTDDDAADTDDGGPGDAANGGGDADADAGGRWDDFGSALENAPGPDGAGATGDADSFGGGGGFDPNDGGGFGGGGGGGGGFGSGGGFGGDFGGGEDFGMGGDFDAPGPSGPEDFDEENFESEIDRLDIGIDGLDEMILGGVPTRSLMVAIGSAGTGKTTFGLQFLNHALEAGDSAVFITLEENRARILDTAEEKGWSFRSYESDGRLAIVDLDPVEMANSLESIQNDLPRLVDEFGADRLVLDSVSLLEMMYDHPSKRRTRVFNFARSLKEAGVTTMLTSEASDGNPYVSRHGIVEYLADAVFVLQYVRPNDFRETRLAIEIQKIRDANHSRETKPYELTSEGISVYGRANIF